MSTERKPSIRPLPRETEWQDIEFRQLTDVQRSELIALMNHPLVRRQMPLLTEGFTEIECDQFIAAKERLWVEHGYGPWAFVIRDRLVGWGGLQPERGDADLALVIHPDYWGIGKRLYEAIVTHAFEEQGLQSITALVPPTRGQVRGLVRLGFVADGQVDVQGCRFNRYRLSRSAKILQGV